MTMQVLAKAPPAINQKQETRGEFAATAVGKAIRAKKIDVGSEVQQYFDARPGSLLVVEFVCESVSACC